MKVKVRKNNRDGVVRVESSGEIKEIMINEEFLHSESESISLCFKGKDSSGIVELTMDDARKLVDALKKRKHLIKDIKIFRDEKE